MTWLVQPDPLDAGADAWSIVILLGFGICSLGLQKRGGAHHQKDDGAALLLLMVVLAVRSITLAGAGEGLRYLSGAGFYARSQSAVHRARRCLRPWGRHFSRLSHRHGQHWPSLAAISDKDRKITGRIHQHYVRWIPLWRSMAGLIILPACSAYRRQPMDSGPWR